MSKLIFSVPVAALSVFLSAVSAFAPTQAQGAQRLLKFAQRDNAYCRNWASQIQTMRSNYTSQCSGSLTPAQAQRCNGMRQQLQDEIQRYNSRCG